MKKMKLFALAIGLIAGVSVASVASRGDIFSHTGDGLLRAVEVLRLTADGWLYLGSTESGNTPSTTYYPHVSIPVKNDNGSAWAQGDLIVVDADCVGCGKVSGATGDLTTWIGIAEGATSDGSVGMVIVDGYAIAKTTGAVSGGDVLVSTTTAGRLSADATPTTGADIAVAVEAGVTAGGTALVLIR